MKKIYVLDFLQLMTFLRDVSLMHYLRIAAFSSLFLIALRFFSDYEFSDEVLIAFPMFYSFFPGALEDKRISSLFFPLLVNIILWCRMKEINNILYGILFVEKWKFCILVLWFSILLLGHLFFYPNSIGKNLCALFISIISYLSLNLAFESFKKSRSSHINRDGKKDDISFKNLTGVLLVHVGIFFLFSIEGQLNIQNLISPSSEIKLPKEFQGDIKDVSLDGNKIIFVSNEEMNKLQVIDLIDDERYEITTSNRIDTARFLEDDTAVVIGEGNIPSREDNKLNYHLKIYNLETGEEVREYNIATYLGNLMLELGFSKNGDFFSGSGYFYKIWECKSRKCIISYSEKDVERELTWISPNTYMVVQRNYWEDMIKVTWNRILKNRNVEKLTKNKMGEYLGKEMKDLYVKELFSRDIDGKYICVVTNGVPLNGLFHYRSNMSFWDVENENMIFSLSGNYQILDTVFLPESNKFLIMEKMKNSTIRISCWNLKTKEKEKLIYLKRKNRLNDGEKIKLRKNGEQVIEIKDVIKIWDII